MSAFLFIPTTADTGLGRRVDFANIASLFADADEPVERRKGNKSARVGLMILVLLGAIGDTLLVARPDALANCLPIAHATPSIRSAVSS